MALVQDKAQDKEKEIAFFDRHAAADDYDVFTPQSSARLIDAFVKLTGLPPGARVIDLGCGSGTFTALLARAGFDCVGLDISAKPVAVGRRKHPQIEFVADRKSTRLNSSHLVISYAVFCLKKKNISSG